MHHAGFHDAFCCPIVPDVNSGYKCLKRRTIGWRCPGGSCRHEPLECSGPCMLWHLECSQSMQNCIWSFHIYAHLIYHPGTHICALFSNIRLMNIASMCKSDPCTGFWLSKLHSLLPHICRATVLDARDWTNADQCRHSCIDLGHDGGIR